MLNELWATLLANLQALALAHQSAHWRSMGESFYGDHQMFQRMYDDVLKEVDGVAEKMLGVTGDDSMLDPARLLTAAALALKSLTPVGDPASALLIAERTFIKQLCGIIEALESLGQLSDGIENMLQGIADKHEEHIYLLQRRVGKEVVAICVKEAIEDSNASSLRADVDALRRLISGRKAK